MRLLQLEIEKSLTWKKVSIFLLVGIVVLIGVVLYQRFSLIRGERIRQEYFQKVQNSEESLAEVRSRLENNTILKNVPNILNVDMSAAGNGWLVYENESRKIKFEYPAQYIKINELIQGDVWNLTLLSKRTKDLSDKNIALVHISNKLSPATYGDINSPDKVVTEKYEIQGEKYDVWNYGMGEGSACGGGSIHTEVIKLKEDLYLHLETLVQQKNVDANCQGNQYKDFRTPEIELNLVRTILNTIEFE